RLNGRTKFGPLPRWSNPVPTKSLPLSTAGLRAVHEGPGTPVLRHKACVLVGPPLSASGTSRGSSGEPPLPVWSVACAKPGAAPTLPIRLKPPEVNAPATSGTVVLFTSAATIVLRTPGDTTAGPFSVAPSFLSSGRPAPTALNTPPAPPAAPVLFVIVVDVS